jgi:anthranilate synthase/aminodeoxychorismate synthase-like glutamine amidotransferase
MNMKKILVIDNYDSFVYNIARYFSLLGFKHEVVRNDLITVEDVKAFDPLAIVISPGPCTPNEAGITLELIRKYYKVYPILGICLGHQAIAQAFGGNVIRAEKPMHGMSSYIRHTGTHIFKGVKNPLAVARYHSLIACSKTLPASLEVLAYCENNQIMAMAHHSYPVVGLQFHPESILTEDAFKMLSNFFMSLGFSVRSVEHTVLMQAM